MSGKQLKQDYQKQIKSLVEALKAYEPEKIILFGSMLYADKPSNDIDLFLIKETKLSRLGERAREARKFLPDQRLPVDILVYTPGEVEEEVNRGNVFIAEILEKGRPLYEQKI